jgi:plasmid stabilization system protein ParE
MTTLKRELFSRSLDSILDYIAKDSLAKSVKFNRDLESVINNISNFPFKARKSFYYDDINTRDLIFKGYTIPYFIDEENNIVALLDIFKWINK